MPLRMHVAALRKELVSPPSKIVGIALSFLAMGTPRQLSYSANGKLVKKLVVS